MSTETENFQDQLREVKELRGLLSVLGTTSSELKKKQDDLRLLYEEESRLEALTKDLNEKTAEQSKNLEHLKGQVSVLGKTITDRISAADSQIAGSRLALSGREAILVQKEVAFEAKEKANEQKAAQIESKRLKVLEDTKNLLGNLKDFEKEFFTLLSDFAEDVNALLEDS